jgi:cyclophilin family peptidyl-prolyl cis-trans isomerase
MEGKVDRRLYILAGFALVAVGIVAAILISRGGGDDGDDASGAGSADGALVSSCEPGGSETGDLSFEGPKEVLSEGEQAVATVATSEGSFEIELDTKRAPITSNSFAFLAEEGFFAGGNFHRIVPGFVIQGGDPLGTGTGGPGYSCVEQPPANLEYTKGVVAMAKSGAEPAGTSASQFFVVTGQNVGLPPEYALLGNVTGGLDVVEKIGALGTPAEKPKRPVSIDSITIGE